MIWLGVIAFALWVVTFAALGYVYVRKGRALVHSLAGPTPEEMAQAQALMAQLAATDQPAAPSP